MLLKSYYIATLSNMFLNNSNKCCSNKCCLVYERLKREIHSPSLSLSSSYQLTPLPPSLLFPYLPSSNSLTPLLFSLLPSLSLSLNHYIHCTSLPLSSSPSPSLSPFLPPSLSPLTSFPTFLTPFPSPPPSLPPSLSPFTSLSPSLFSSLSFFPSFSPSLFLSHPPSLPPYFIFPPSLPPSFPPFLSTSLPPSLPLCLLSL